MSLRPNSYTPESRSSASFPADYRKVLEASNLPIEVATAIADRLDGCFGPNGEDQERLWFVSQMMDGIGDIDFHERAMFYAEVSRREEPNKDDYLEAVRDGIDSALTRHTATNSEGSK